MKKRNNVLEIKSKVPEIQARAERLFAKQQRAIFRDTDRLFAVLMAVQWFAAIVYSLWWSRSVSGGSGTGLGQYWVAVIFGGIISILPIALALNRSGRLSTRIIIACSQMLMSSLLVYLNGGNVQTHFHVFGSLAFLSFYRDWRVLVPATVIVFFDHVFREAVLGQSFYGGDGAESWRWAEFAGWVLFEEIFLLIAIRRSVREMWSIAIHTAEVEHFNVGLEQMVEDRTFELDYTNRRLSNESAFRCRLQAESEIAKEISVGVAQLSELDDCFAHIRRTLGTLVRFDSFMIAKTEGASGTLIPIFVDDEKRSTSINLELQLFLAKRVMKLGQAVSLAKDDIRVFLAEAEDDVDELTPKSWLGVPLGTGARSSGVLAIQSFESEVAFSEEDERLLLAVGSEAALVIEQKRIEDKVRQDEIRFRDLFENAPVAYHELDVDGCYVRLNNTERALLGYTNEEMAGRHVSEIVADETIEKLTAAALAKTGTQIAVERVFIHKDGRRISVLNEDRLITDSRGDIKGIRSTLQDITERKGIEEKLRRGQKLESIGQLAAGIAHEINTPVQYVGDNVRFLESSFRELGNIIDLSSKLTAATQESDINSALDDLAAAIKDVDIAFYEQELPVAFDQTISGIDQISRIVQSMRDFARPDSTGKQRSDINQAIESTITVASGEWRYVADLDTALDRDLPMINCHIGEINEVLLIMIVNAADAITEMIDAGKMEKGKIVITSRRTANSIEIRVSDNGAGIPEEIQDRIFDPFFTTKDVGSGDGQGLAIAHSIIVEKHAGTIDVESEPGCGATFIIELPISEIDAASVPKGQHQMERFQFAETH